MIVIFDVGGPLAAYSLLRSTGMGTVSALLLSGVFPAAGVAIGAIRHRRLDVVGALVLAGILVGTVLGLVSHSARLLLVEGSVPTAIFAVGCLGSLRARRPLIYSFALEFIGPDTAKGREMTMFWQHEGFRRSFRVITAVWGVAFLLEAALRVHRQPVQPHRSGSIWRSTLRGRATGPAAYMPISSACPPGPAES
jgi:hypothetical protein